MFNPGGSTAQIVDEELGIVSIYPNPVNDVLSIHLDKPELFQAYEITDLNGNTVAGGMIFTHNTTISTAGLAGGVYMIRLISNDKIIVEKIVKH